jgi:hypothetical protein
MRPILPQTLTVWADRVSPWIPLSARVRPVVAAIADALGVSVGTVHAAAQSNHSKSVPSDRAACGSS